MLHCSLKSALMHILGKLHAHAAELTTHMHNVPNQELTTHVPIVPNQELTTHVHIVPNQELTTQVSMKVSIIDGMAEVQSLDKPEWIKTAQTFQITSNFIYLRNIRAVMRSV
jgi:hypothetical protein